MTRDDAEKELNGFSGLNSSGGLPDTEKDEMVWKKQRKQSAHSARKQMEIKWLATDCVHCRRSEKKFLQLLGDHLVQYFSSHCEDARGGKLSLGIDFLRVFFWISCCLVKLYCDFWPKLLFLPFCSYFMKDYAFLIG